MKTLGDLDHREKTKISKIKVLNAKQVVTKNSIERLQERLLENMPVLAK
jgi:hypothetical protein